MTEIKLGDKVKCKLTRLKGTVTAKAEYLYGCTQLEVQPRKLVNGMIVEPAWIDEPQLELIEQKKVKKAKPNYGGVRLHPR